MLTVSLLALAAIANAKNFKLKILHTNDIHARVDPINKYGSACDPTEKNDCFGGAARRVQAVKDLKADSDYPVLVLDGGDQFQGSLWYTVYRGVEAYKTMNLVGYDAMGLGNHEFDNGGEALERFVNNVDADILSCNVDWTGAEPAYPGLAKIKKHVVFDVEGEKIGIIGYTISNIQTVSSPPEGIVVHDVFDSVTAEVKVLKKKGVNKIIAIGHHGYLEDVRMANDIEGLDVVVGGHTNTFLYNGDPIEVTGNENARPKTADGPYPTWNEGKSTCVVQDYAFGRWMGNLDVEWDGNGNIVDCVGQPVLMSDEFGEDKETFDMLAEMDIKLKEFGDRVMGFNRQNIPFERNRWRMTEHVLTNWIGDAMIEYAASSILDGGGFYKDIPRISMMNGGGLRNGLPAGQLTWRDATPTMPFDNAISLLEIPAKTIWDTLEHGVAGVRCVDYANMIDCDNTGGFVYGGGLRYTYDIGRDPYDRLMQVKVACNDEEMAKWCEIDPNDEETKYMVVINSYIATGGDGHEALKNVPREGDLVGTDLFQDSQILAYMLSNEVLMTEDGRIRQVNSKNPDNAFPSVLDKDGSDSKGPKECGLKGSSLRKAKSSKYKSTVDTACECGKFCESKDNTMSWSYSEGNGKCKCFVTTHNMLIGFGKVTVGRAKL